MSGLQIIPRHYWTGKNAAGETRDLTKTTLEPPVGSGPYRVKSVDPGRNIVYERVPDYWAKDLPVNRGQWNFDSLAFTSFRDEVPAFEAFKAGVFDLQQENNSKRWAIEYQFPAARDGRVARLEIPTKTVAPAQAFVFNMRRERFADPRVRHAFELAFDFETANRDLFYGQYTRLQSYFDNSELAARGLPQGAELALLEQVRDKVPPEVFTTEFKSTVNGGPEALRGHLREAVHLLEEAGWKLDGARRKSKAGVPLSMEMLVYDTSFDRILLPYQQALAKLGITLTIRVVDAPQYVERVNRFDFDMIIDSFPQTHAPGNEQRDYWGSQAADRPASRNTIGIKNPAVDFLIEHIINAPDRDGVVAATRALDRVLLWNYYAVLQWHRPGQWIAYWNKFGHPAKFPSQSPGWLQTWWFDPQLASATLSARTK